MRYFEDFTVGDHFVLGERALSREEIVAFALEWDPQAFHTGERDSAYGQGIIASGVQTIAVWMRMFVDGVLSDAAVVAGKDVDHMLMALPVTPGMRVKGTADVLAVSAGPSGRGEVRFRGALLTVEGEELVWEQTGTTVFECRPIEMVHEPVPDPVTLTLYAPEDEAIEDALLELDEEGAVAVSAIVLGDDGRMGIVIESELDADAAVAALLEAVPGLEILERVPGRQV